MTSSCLSSGKHDQSSIYAYLTAYREEDVSQTMYRETLKVAPAEPRKAELEALKGVNLSKVNRICDTFLKVLESRGSVHIQNTITAHVCESPPDLDAGLAEIAKMRCRFHLSYCMHGCVLSFLAVESYIVSFLYYDGNDRRYFLLYLYVLYINSILIFT